MNSSTKRESRFLPPTKRKYAPPTAFREIARAEGYVIARQGDDFPWVFEIAEWEAMEIASLH